MSGYSKERREWAVAQMLPPQSRRVPELAKASGISDVTLYNWRLIGASQGQTRLKRPVELH
ncbi:MAG: transposase [Gammaproteobacteria bacterium]|nr:transposase [Gammaproteobacteria bacterium]